MDAYIQHLIDDLANSAAIAQRLGAGPGAAFDRRVDSIYFGGGTPSLLDAEQFTRVIETTYRSFEVAAAEITVECAPNSVSDEILAAMTGAGVNRISFGAQSFVDRETSSVARLHQAADTVRDVERIRHAGIENISLDLIAGLPYQTLASWEYSLDQVIALGVPHCSVYMLEVDQESRLGRELIAGGTRYHAHTVPDEELIVAMYECACEKLGAAGIAQYEISNFARPGWESRHNLKYWLREPYFGFGADAHSMLSGARDLRFATPEELADFENAADHYSGPVQRLNSREALEEAIILGLRLNRGITLAKLAEIHGEDPQAIFKDEFDELTDAALLMRDADRVRLTPRGRLLSNEVFERFIGSESREITAQGV